MNVNANVVVDVVGDGDVLDFLCAWSTIEHVAVAVRDHVHDHVDDRDLDVFQTV